MLVKNVAEGANAWLALIVVERPPERVRVDYVPLIRLVDRPLDLRRSSDGGQVEESADRPGDGDVRARGDIRDGQGRAAMAADPAQPCFGAPSDADVDVVPMLFAELPKRGGAAVGPP